MLHIFPEEMLEDYAHNKQGEQWGEQAPEHTEICALVFLLEVPLHKLGEEEAVLLEFLNRAEHKPVLFMVYFAAERVPIRLLFTL